MSYTTIGGGKMTTTITIRLDSDTKTKFDQFCDSVGIATSTAINMFIKATLRKNEIPFKIKADPFYSESNQALLRKSIEQMEDSSEKLNG